jgi:sulfide:quinone oxidoreductase
MATFLILGGGFGGLAAAHELRRQLDGDHEVVLVDRNDRFFMGFAKLWDLAGVRPLAEGTRSLHNLDAKGVRFVQADITRIDPEARSVETSAGTLTGDALLVALGAGDHPDQTAQLVGDAHNLYDPNALPAMRAVLQALNAGRLLIAVLGQPLKCPPAPFEAALLIDEELRRRRVRDAVELIVATPSPSALPVAGPEASQFVADQLAARGIGLHTGHLLTEVDGNTAWFDTGRELSFRALFGVPGVAPPQVVADSAVAGEGGWIRPDARTLRTSFDRVYAVGDCTTVPTATAALPKAGVFAAGEAVAAARNMVADVLGGDEASFDGHGFCYLEFPEREVAVVEGDFFALPAPEVAMSAPSREAFEAKLTFERERLDAWLG